MPPWWSVKLGFLAHAQVYKPATGADVITMRDYAGGVLRRENVLRIGQVDHHKNEVKADRALRSEEKRANAKVSEHANAHAQHAVAFPMSSGEATSVNLAFSRCGCRPVDATEGSGVV